jgi:hypothetical protein
MKIALFFLFFISVAAGITFAEDPSTNSNSGKLVPMPSQEETRAWVAAMEAKMPPTELPAAYFENADGTISYGFKASTNNTVYLLKEMSINPKDIPHLNVQVDGSNYYPGSVPYRDWSSWPTKYIDPPPNAYYWDDKAGGFRAGYQEGERLIILRRGDELYQKSSLPPGARILDAKGFTIIPMKMTSASSPTSKREKGEKKGTGTINDTT